MTEIKRIKNLKVSATKEKLANDWNEVKSFKNRLLQNSDWINMPDNDLQDDIVRLWVDWRKRVRRVEEFMITDVSKALDYLVDLQNNQPPVKYKNDEYATVEHFKAELNKMLSITIKKATDGIYELTDSRELLMERFEEAIRYLDGLENNDPKKLKNNFLLDLEVLHTDLTHEELANKFIQDRKNYLMKLITIEKVKKKYLKQIDTVDNFKDCANIRDELLTLGTKKWI